jgi:plasmid stabilization system protein ParE
MCHIYKFFTKILMPRGDKSKYTDKQKRQAEHIEEGYEEKGVPEDEAEARAWATVNKLTGGGKKPGGSGRAKSAEKKTVKKAVKKSGDKKSRETQKKTSKKSTTRTLK